MTAPGVVIRPLGAAEAEAHVESIDGLIGLIGCEHEPGAALTMPEYQLSRWDVSVAAWNDHEIIGVALASWYPVDVANAKRIPEDFQYPADSYYLDHLAVAEAFQHQRVGQQLMRKWMELAAALARRHGRPEVNLSLESGADEDTARVRRFYEQRGFTPVGSHLKHGRQDVVWWQSRRF